ncbi:MAG: hypothetical protein ABIR24_10685 [Verrucomicrobiota bacterium]
MNVIQYLGLDVHNDSIALSIAPSNSAEVRRYGIIGERHGGGLAGLRDSSLHFLGLTEGKNSFQGFH